MKKLRFLTTVPDKYTGETYKEGQEYKFEDKRANEILASKRPNGKPYAEEIKEIEVATKKVKTEKAVIKKRVKKNDI